MAEVSPEIRQALLDVFSVLDRNGSMQIDQKEIGFLMNKMLHFNLTELEISEIMSEVCDSDAPGVGIDFDMFVKALGPALSACSEEELNKLAFEALDEHKTGTLSMGDVAPVMSAVAGANVARARTKLPASHVTEVVSLASSGGPITFDDFCKVVTEEKK